MTDTDAVESVARANALQFATDLINGNFQASPKAAAHCASRLVDTLTALGWRPPGSAATIERETLERAADEIAKTCPVWPPDGPPDYVSSIVNDCLFEAHRAVLSLRGKTAMPSDIELGKLAKAIYQVEKCNFECEGGPLRNNIGWIALRAAILALSPPASNWQEVLEPTHTHRKGGNYTLLGVGKIQSDEPLRDMDEVAIYRAEKDGSLWARRKAEFEDGRFTTNNTGAKP